MARSREEIEQQMITEVENDATLGSVLTSTSKTAVWRLIIYVVSYAMYLHERIVELNAENSRPHTLRWYREEASNFMDGHELTWKDGQFKYDLSELSENEIDEAKKVKHVAVTESANGVLVIKTATTDSSGDTQPLDVEVHERFQSYMKQIKDAGNRLNYVNTSSDGLQLELVVWVDDMIIDLNDGSLLADSSKKPVEDACYSYLEKLEFNGTFVNTFLIDEIQKGRGIKLPKLTASNHRVPGGDYESYAEYVMPFSGHFKIETINIEYKKWNEVA